MTLRHVEEQCAQQGRSGQVDVQHARRLFLQHQDGVVVGGREGLELNAALGQVEPG